MDLYLKRPKSYFDINARTKDGATAFMIACIKGHKNIIKMFIENRERLSIDFNAKNSIGWTGLTFASELGRLDIVKLLTKKEMDVEVDNGDENGTTPFMIACSAGREDIVLYYIKHCDEKKIVYNKVDNEGWTAFHHACYNGGFKNVVKMLVNHNEKLGIDLDHVENDGKTGYDFLNKSFRESLRAKRPRLEV